MIYDPREHGAECDRCFLAEVRTAGPVAPEANPGAWFALVGDFPGVIDVAEGRPFTGPDGDELMVALRQGGARRGEAHVTTAVLCVPPDNDYAGMLRKLAKRNRARKAEGIDPMPNPIDACRPRLMSEIDAMPNVIPVGGKGLQAVIGGNTSILAVRGGFIDGVRGDDGSFTTLPVDPAALKLVLGSIVGRRQKVMPTIHPSFVLRARRWTRVLRVDVSRALRWFRGMLAWSEPQIDYQPSPEALRAFLGPSRPLAYDVETDALDPTTARLRCLAIGNGDHVVVAPLLGINGRDKFYTTEDEREIRRILREWFVSTRHPKIGHNAGYYDRLNIEQHFGVTPRPLLDTILLHRSVESELPHNLGFVGSVYTDVHAWKADRTAISAETDHELHRYCALDVAVDFRVTKPLADHVELRGQTKVVLLDHETQEGCVEMRRNGLFVDQRRRASWEYRITEKMEHWRSACEHFAGGSINPGSVNQVRDLLFDRWKLPIPDGVRMRKGKEERYLLKTKGGDPSTADESIRALLLRDEPDDRARAFLDALRRYRSASKLLGTYILKLVPMSVAVATFGVDLDDADATPEGMEFDAGTQDVYEEAERKAIDRYRQKEAKRGIVRPNGRIYPDYSAHRTTSGRLASSNPNAQNWPAALRAIIVAPPGRVLVGADSDQLQLRVAAAHWRVRVYLDAFRDGRDPHAETTKIIFGERFTRAKGWPDKANGIDWHGEAKSLRKTGKTVKFASIFAASAEAAWRVITSEEDDAGNLPFLRMSRRDVRSMQEAWIAGVPEIPAGWQEEQDRFREQGFLTEPVMHRRRDFLDGDDRSELVNFPIQGAEASIMAGAMKEVRRGLGDLRTGPGTGLIANVHDQLVLEVDERHGEAAAALLNRCMNLTVPELPGVKFTTKAAIGHDWKQV